MDSHSQNGLGTGLSPDPDHPDHGESAPRPVSRRRAIWASATAIVLLLIAIPALAEISSRGEETWGVYNQATGTQMDAINNLVWSMEQVGDRMYVGGKFLEARPNANGTPVAQPFLAAFDVNSGDFIDSFRPNLEGPVHSLQASPDGSRLYVGGEFASINGDTNARGLAALDPATGAVDTSFRARMTNASGARPVVKSLTISGDHLYLGGRFDTIVSQGVRHTSQKLARVSLSDGTPDTSLSIEATGGMVWGVAVAPSHSKIFLAGYHDTVNGDTRGADFSVIDANTGELLAEESDTGGNSANSARWYGQAVVTAGDYVFWGGSEHIVRVHRISDSSLVREHSTDRGGDYQVLEVVGDRVYGGCHCYTNHLADFNYWLNRGWATDPNGPQPSRVDPIRYVAAYSTLTGEYIPTFQLDASAEKSGVWAIHGDTNGCLWVGGDLTRITSVRGVDRAAGGFAQFCEGDGGDTRAPDTPPNLVQTRSETTKIVLRWDAAADNLGTDHYEIWRSGELIGTRDHGFSAQYWFTDQGLEEATQYGYEVVAVDAAGNRSVPATIAAATVGFVEGGDSEAPSTPSGLVQTRSESNKIVIKFGASTDNIGVVNYEISRDGVVAGTKNASTATAYWFTDRDLESGTTYRYSVVAVDMAGNRSAPATLDATTEGGGGGGEQLPPAPESIRTTFQSRDRIVLNWAKVAGADGYVLLRRQGGGEWAEIVTKSGVWHTDRTVSTSTTYEYTVLTVIGDQRSTIDSAPVVEASTLP